MFKAVEHKLHLVDSLETNLAGGEHGAQGGQLGAVVATELDDGLQGLDGLGRDALLGQLGIDVVEPYLVELVDSYGDIHNLVGLTDNLCYAGENLAVVHLNAHANAKLKVHGINHLHEVHLVEQ